MDRTCKESTLHLLYDCRFAKTRKPSGYRHIGSNAENLGGIYLSKWMGYFKKQAPGGNETSYAASLQQYLRTFDSKRISSNFKGNNSSFFLFFQLLYILTFRDFL